MIDDSTNGETAFDVINALVNDVIDSAIEQSCKVTISFLFYFKHYRFCLVQCNYW